MTIALVLEVVHVLAVFWFISGLMGRAVAQSLARRATDLPRLETLRQVSSHFEMRMVRPGSLLLLVAGLLTAYLKGWPILGPLTGQQPCWVLASLVVYLTPFTLIPLVFIPRGRRFQAALAGARTHGAITPQLTAALDDRVVAMAHAWEWIAVVIITVLMIAKPF